MTSPAPLRILLVEDDRTSRFVLRRMIEADGPHEIHEADDGLRAWEALLAGLRPDLCFIDLNMPRMNGIELLRRIRADSRMSGMRFCFCSAVRDRAQILQVAALKPEAYILKPYSREAIQTELRRAKGLPNLSDSLEDEASACARLGIDAASYRSRLSALLREVQDVTKSLPTRMMRYDVGTALVCLERLRGLASQLGARRIQRMADGLLHCIESNGGRLVAQRHSRSEIMLQFQQCLTASADTLMQTMQDFRKESEVIQGFLQAPEGGGIDAGDEAAARSAAEVMALHRALAEVFQQGRLVGGRSTRSKSLTVPIKAAILGKDAARTVGAVTRRTSFSMTILDPETGKAVEECRKTSDLVKLLGFPLDASTRWLPDKAIRLLEAEVAVRNAQGVMLLKTAIGDDVEAFLRRQEEIVRQNLDLLHGESGTGETASEAQVNSILEEIRERLLPPLNGQLTQDISYTTLELGNLSQSRDDSLWASPSSLLYHAATLQRNALVDPGFDRVFKFSTFDREALLAALDVFGDGIVGSDDVARAEEGLRQLEAVRSSPISEFERCRLYWGIIKETRDNPARQGGSGNQNPSADPTPVAPAPAGA